MQGYNLLVDKGVLEKVDYKQKDIFAILVLLFRNQQSMIARTNDGKNCFVSSPSGLYGDFLDVTGTTRTQRSNFVNSLQRLVDNKIIEVIEVNGKKYTNKTKIQWNSLLKIDCNNLIHKSRKPFVMLNTIDIGDIVEQDDLDFNTLLQVYVDVISYINQDDVIQADLGKIDLNYEIYGDMSHIHLSCWASIDTLCTKRYSGDKNNNQWISNKTMIKALNILVEIGLLAKVTPKSNNGQVFPNHYCYKRHEKMVQKIADNKARQILYYQ